MSVRVQCPYCGKALKVKQVPGPGKRLLCSGCTRSFPVPADLAAKAASLTPMPASLPAPPPQPSSATPLPASILKPIAPPAPSAAILRPVPPPIPLQPVPSSGTGTGTGSGRGLLVGVVVGGLLLLIGSTAVAVALAWRVDRHKNADVLARNDTNLDGSSSTNPSDSTDSSRTTTPRSKYQYNDDSPPAQPRSKTDQQQGRNDFRPPPMSQPNPVNEVRSSLSREQQAEVNAAIDKGVAFLKKTQLDTGSWEYNHPVGLAALPALTLLECGVKPDDPAIQKAAKYVRENVMAHNFYATYECSLALLFLDRLGDSRDKALIRALALRIVAGQLPGGGWTYGLPNLAEKEQSQLLEFLEKTRPERNLGLMVRNRDDKLDKSVESSDRKSSSATYEALDTKKPDKDGGGNVKDFDSEPKRARPLSQQEAKKAFDKLPGSVQNAPAVKGPVNKTEDKPEFGAGDNSNTQFATLALWAARRHDLPLERALDAVGKRFRDSQSDAGTWGYVASVNAGGTPAMTGAGLLGLAVGHGSATDPNRKFKVKDPQIDKGLKALGQHVGKPLGGDVSKTNKKGKLVFRRHQTAINLYFLWTVERVGVLYAVSELDGKDWYLWGTELLLPVQTEEGSWQDGGYHGATKHVDTSFALLFLKRANLASDLTQRLDFAVEGKPVR